MKLHHAAAIAIWYLIVPPESSLLPDHDYPAKAPLPEWHIIGSVESQAECDRQNRRFIYTLTQEPNVSILINTPMNLARCISADEARAAGLIKAPAIRRR